MNDPTSHACVLCDAPASAGHHRGCPGADPHAISYLDQRLPDGTKRIWTLAGVQYTGTPARRAAITDLMPTVTWRPAADAQPVPFMVAGLLTEIVPKLGIARWLSHFAYHDDAFVTAPDCGCVDPLRCRCDTSDNPAGEWAHYQLIGLRVRTHPGWLELWLLDLGAAAVIIAEDDRGDPIPPGASRDCAMGWCHRCDGTRAAQPTPAAYRHTCHHLINGKEATHARR